MPFHAFRLKSTLSPSVSVGLSDAHNAKDVFRSLGYYKPPKHGMTDIPDNALFEGIKQFQSDNSLKRDGVMKPGGETEQAIGKILEKEHRRDTNSSPTLGINPNPKPSLLGSLPRTTPPISPGEHDPIKRRQPIVVTKQVEQQLKPLKDFLDTIAKAARNNEIVSSNARTVQAVLKTTNHRDLAKVHAAAIEDSGDEALAEVINFKNQLLAASKPAHDNWLREISKEMPEKVERMMMAINAEDVTSKSEDQHNLLEKSIGTPPRKPVELEKHGPTKDRRINEDFGGVDLDFVHEQEGLIQVKLDVPSQNGKVIGKSGATVGYGVDLGQMNTSEMQRLVDDYGLPQELADKLHGYTGKTKEEAQQFLKQHPLTISEDEAIQLTNARYSYTLDQLRDNVNKYFGEAGSFDNLPAPVKTVVFDLSVHHGPAFLDKAPRFRSHLIGRDVEGMISELRNYYNNPDKVPKAFINRRNREADHLKLLPSV